LRFSGENPFKTLVKKFNLPNLPKTKIPPYAPLMTFIQIYFVLLVFSLYYLKNIKYFYFEKRNSVSCGISAAEVFSGGQRQRLASATTGTGTDRHGRHLPSATGNDRQVTLTEFYS